MDWNNTGVYKNFACAAGMVMCQEGWIADAEYKNWKMYKLDKKCCIATFSRKDLGIMAIFESEKPKETLQNIIRSNSDTEKLKTQFQFPNGDFIEYDVYTPKNKWILKKVNKKKLDNDFDIWPLINGNFE
jgi:hypothetical protein